MTVFIQGKNTDCPIIKYTVTTLDSMAIAEGFYELENMVFLFNKSKLICDMTRIENSILSDTDFEQLQGGMFHILLSAPSDFMMAIAVSCEKLRDKLKSCHNEIRNAGFQHDLFVAMSENEASELLNIH